MSLVLIMFWVAFVASVIVLIGTLFGRRAGTHPHCRRCGYDLSAHADGASECPECGRVLRGSNDVQRGLRVRSRELIAVAGLAVAIAIAGAAVEYVPSLASAAGSAMASRPTPSLIDDLRRHPDDAAARQRIISLLEARIAAGNVTPTQAAPLVEMALAQQADRAVPWDPAWGRAVETCASNGLATGEQIVRYVQQAFELVALEERPLRAHEAATRLELHAARSGLAALSAWAGSVDMLHAEIGGVALPVSDPTSKSGNPGSASANYSSDAWRWALDLPAGTHALRALWRISIDMRELNRDPKTAALLGGRVMPSWTVATTTPVRVLDAPPPLFEYVEDDAALECVQRSLARSARLIWRNESDGPRLSISLSRAECPLGVDARVVLIAGTERLRHALPTYRCGGTGIDRFFLVHTGQFDTPFPGPPPERMTIRLEPTEVPDPIEWRDLLRTQERIPLLRRTIVLPDVPVRIEE